MQTDMRVIAFDLFGTVVDMSTADKEDLREYGRQLKQNMWKPLVLPQQWAWLPAFEDSARGLARLRSRHIVVTCSNAPLGLQAKLCKYNDLRFDALIPLELNQVYKTNPVAYLTVCEVLGVKAKQVTMVTANETFGDLEASAALGMTPRLIRGHTNQTILDLAVELGC